MGEIAINPIHNVHKQYRQMIYANPYRFGVYVPPIPPNNTFIGGVASVINTPALLAAKLLNYPSGTAFDSANIQNFTIVGSDIECYIGVDYSANFNGLFDVGIRILTYFSDFGNFCKNLNVFYQINLEYFNADGILKLGQRNFANCYKLKIALLPSCVSSSLDPDFACDYFAGSTLLKIIYLPNCLNFGQTVGSQNAFRNINETKKIYVHPSMATINSGGIEGDLVGHTVSYVSDLTDPNPITDLSVVTVYGTALQLNFTAPTGSTNSIDFYEVWVNGFLTDKRVTPNGYITGLALNTTYNIEVKPVDIYYNKSTSNIVSQATSATYVIPTANIVSNWQMENNVLDSVGSNDGTATAIAYDAGLVGQTAIFNGTTSIVKMTGYNTGFNAVDFSVVQLFKTTQTTAFRLLQNRGQGGAGVTKGWQISYNATGNWGNIAIDDGLSHFFVMDNISYLENDNVWHSLVMTWEASTGTCRVYIDGVFKGLKTDALLINADLNGLDVCFGGSNTNGQLFNGQGDEAAIFNKLLIPVEITEIEANLRAGQHLI